LCSSAATRPGREAREPFVSLPAGVPHRYKAGEQGGSLLMLFTPSGMECYFRDWAELVRAHKIAYLPAMA